MIKSMDINIKQCAIDNAKRRFDIDLTREIQRIKENMNIKENKYPMFWKAIKKDFNDKNINPDLVCPMNCLYNIKVPSANRSASTLPISYFFKKYDLDISRKKSKKVEALINEYSFNINNYNLNTAGQNKRQEREDEYFILRKDFDDIVNEIRMVSLSRNYLGLMSWLIDRCFVITPQLKSNQYSIQTKIKKSKMNLMKVLYEVNSANLLKCFSKNCG